MKYLGIFLALLTACSGAEPREKLQVFLLLGQSNMAGRAAVEEVDKLPHPHIVSLNAGNIWVEAVEPLHFDKPDLVGVGPGFAFARELVALDAELRVGLVPCAVGGSSLEEWRPGSAHYVRAVARAKVALRTGKLAGILWHQGEADRTPEKVASYGGRFAAFAAALRRDLGAPDAIIVVGEVGHFLEGSDHINAVLGSLPTLVPNCITVSTEGLTDKGDGVHFDTKSQRTLGVRYARAWLNHASSVANAASRDR